MVVENTGLKTECRADFAGVGDGAATLRIDRGKTGKNVSQSQGAHKGDSPPKRTTDPMEAKFEGSSAMPLPIMLSATMPVQAIRPIFLA